MDLEIWINDNKVTIDDEDNLKDWMKIKIFRKTKKIWFKIKIFNKIKKIS